MKTKIFLGATLLASALGLSGQAYAGLPGTTLIDGALTSSGGSAAADGDYDVAFSIYAASSGGSAVWTETAKVKVGGGRFSHPLGSVKAIDAGALAGLAEQWLELKVGADPALPRQRMHAATFALAAGEAAKLSCAGCVSGDQLANGGIAAGKVGFNFAGADTKGGPANDVACTNCVNVGDMKFDGDVDLAGNSIKGKNGTFSGTVAAAEFVGDGSKLTGLKTPAGECKNAGEVVKGINADGSLKCVVALDPAALPKDGLNEISNELISNQFVDTIQGQASVPIPDNTGAEAISNLDFLDIGTAQAFELYVEVANTDLSKVSMTVLPPDDKKTGWTLCDPCGKTDDKSYKVTFSKDNLPKSGDLAKWLGGNPKGLWNLKILDSGYCVPQAPGNETLCNPTAKTDGSIVKWHIKIQTLSNKKIAINGDTYQGGKAYLKDVDASGAINVAGTLTVGGVVQYPTRNIVFNHMDGNEYCCQGWKTQGNSWQDLYSGNFKVTLTKRTDSSRLRIHWHDNVGISGGNWCNVAVWMDGKDEYGKNTRSCSGSWHGDGYGYNSHNTRSFECVFEGINKGDHTFIVRDRSGYCYYGNYPWSASGGSRALIVEEIE